MELGTFLSLMTGFPVAVFFFPFALCLLILMLDLVFNFVDGLLPDLDLFDFDDVPGAGLILPPVLTKVPLMLALTTSFFLATVAMFYSQQVFTHLLADSLQLPVTILSIPLVAYISLWGASWLLCPLIPLFEKNRSSARIEFIGMRGRVHSNQITATSGEVMVLHDGREILLDAMAYASETMDHGDSVIILDKDQESKRYIIKKSKSK
ncbi:DUF1449 domain-containing protein [Vibrio sp. SCSIO 43136]|uniref:DUF1449 domain-containing protein n=1 Tax=Vibrio sp. SCSIO 43136 TaxID=2819101 RepID=UPI00207541E7|nr:DUF1449 domain-containing protein [Vibrio sp. SCSIO 43136]USD65679.1 DUF1449 domain-containing protein [Vibrio sp. SCSIO 43136]